MHRIETTEESERELRRHFTHHPCAQVRLRCLAVSLRANGLTQAQVEAITGAATSSQTIWARQWCQSGLEALLESGHRGRQSSITPAAQQILIDQFAVKPPSTLAEARERIQETTGKRFSIAGTRKVLLGKLKLRHRKAKQVPPRCDDLKKKTEQDQWQAQTLEPLLKQALKREINLFFLDAAHFTMLTGLGYVWSVMVCWVRSMAGRKRHSVLGALNAVSHQLVTVTTAATVTSETMKDLLSKLHATLGETGVKTVIILDNARYQHCAAVKEWAEGLNITLEFLPGYSPHLNLIERVWKFIRKTTLTNRYFTDFEHWSSAIDGCVDDINSGEHADALKSLLAWNFQTFNIDKIIV